MEKLVYIGSNIPDKTPAAVRVFANALALKNYGYDVKLISSDAEYKMGFDVNEGIETWHLHYPQSLKEWASSLVDSRRYTAIIDRIGDVRVVLAYGLSSVVFLRLRQYCKKNGIKLICETTEWQKWDELGHLGFFSRAIRLLDINVAMYYSYKKSDAIIVSSHFFADYFKKYLPVLSLPTLQCQRLNLGNAQVTNNPRKFIYAGGIGYQKDMLCEIIHAFSDIVDRDFEFNILGLSKEQYAERFKEDIALVDRINSKNEKIKFWGRVTHSVVLKELSNSDFSLIIRQSSRRNNVGFPTKYGESINCGTPVIVSDFSDVAYYTNKYMVGIVTDLYRISDSLQEALDMDETVLKEMKTRCRNCEAFFYKDHIEELGSFVEKSLQTKD